jgi:hypothetical protein
LPRPRLLSARWAWGGALCLVVPAAANTLFHALTPVTAATAPAAAAQAAAHPSLAQLAALQFLLPALAVSVAVLAWRASAAAPRLARAAGAFLAGGYLLGTLDAVSNLLPAVMARSGAVSPRPSARRRRPGGLRPVSLRPGGLRPAACQPAALAGGGRAAPRRRPGGRSRLR